MNISKNNAKNDLGKWRGLPLTSYGWYVVFCIYLTSQMCDGKVYRLFGYSLLLFNCILYYPFVTLSYMYNKHACHSGLSKLHSLWGRSNIAHHLRYLFGVYPLVILQNQRWHHEESHHDKYSMRRQSHRTIFWVFKIIKKKKRVKSFLAHVLLRNVFKFDV